MGLRRFTPAMVVLVALGTLALSPAAVAAAPAGPLFGEGWSKPLPASSRSVQVDPVTNRVFISSWKSNVVTVLGLDGEVQGSIAVPGADDMLLDGPTLYVAATTAGRIDAFNTATLAPAGSYGAGTLDSPGSLAKAGGRVWSTTGACFASQQLVSFVPGNPSVTVHPVTVGLQLQCTSLHASAAYPNLLVGYEGGRSATTVFRLDVSTGTPVRTGTVYADAFTSDLEFLPGGQTFALATRATGQILTFQVDPLQQGAAVYSVGSYPGAVESTAGNGGLLAVARNGLSSADIIVMRLDSTQAPFFGSTPSTVKGGGVAFSPDGSSLYAVSSDDNTGAAMLTIFGPPDQGRYHPLPPARILDTRNSGANGRLGPDSTADVQVTGRGGVPATGVSAALNVTVTQPTAISFLTLYPSGRPRPLASALNYTPAKTVPNLVVVKVGAGGKVSMYNLAGATHVIFDIAGWYSNDGDAPAADGRYTALAPSRLLDTRDGGRLRLGPDSSLDLQVAGRGGVPGTGAGAAVLNVAATGTTATSFLTVHPTGMARPLAANLNFDAGQSVSNRVMATLGAGGKVTIYNLAGFTDIVVDVAGWYSDTSATPANPGTLTSTSPFRLLDTRTAYGAAPLAGGTAMTVFVTIPPSPIRAVMLNVTVVDPAGPGFLTLFPTGGQLPLASDLNYAGGETRPNLAVVQVGADGKIVLYTSTTAHVVLDVAGWFS